MRSLDVKRLIIETGGLKGNEFCDVFGMLLSETVMALPLMNMPFPSFELASIHATVCSHSSSEESAKSKNSSKLLYVIVSVFIHGPLIGTNCISALNTTPVKPKPPIVAQNQSCDLSGPQSTMDPSVRINKIRFT